jgi:hypothetical protein
MVPAEAAGRARDSVARAANGITYGNDAALPTAQGEGDEVDEEAEVNMSKPPQHGKISEASMPRKHMKQHLDAITQAAGEVVNYHRGGGRLGKPGGMFAGCGDGRGYFQVPES